MKRAVHVAALTATLALCHAVSTDCVARADHVFSFSQDDELRLFVAVLATPTFVGGDLIFLARGTTPAPLWWSTLELLPAAGWAVISFNDYDPNLNPAAALFAAGFAAHALVNIVFVLSGYEPARGADATPQPPPNPPKPPPGRLTRRSVSPALWLDRHGVSLGIRYGYP